MTRKRFPALAFDAARLAAVVPFVSTDPGRRYITGVRFEPHLDLGALAIATDGQALAVAHDPEGVCEAPRIISIPSAVVAPSVAKPGAVFRLSTVRARQVALVERPEDKKGRLPPLALGEAPEIEDRYPNWRKVIPGALGPDRAGPPGSVMLAHGLLARFAKLRQGAGLSPRAPFALHIRPGRGSAASLVCAPAAPWFVGVVMPVSGEAPPQDWADFLPKGVR